MPVDPLIDEFLQGPGRSLAFPRAAHEDPAVAAEYLATTRERLAQPAAVPLQPIVDVRDESLPSGRPVRVYRGQPGSEAPIVVYLHGGGWVVGGLEMNDGLCRRFASDLECVVVSVDYRLAPEHRYPAALEDVLEAIEWARGSAAQWGGDPDNVSVAGTSAGGNLAAAAALWLRDHDKPPLRAQVLLNPVLDASMRSDSYRRNGVGFLLDEAQMEWFWREYLGDQFTDPPVYASPARAGDLAGLPSAVVLACEYDPLCDEDEAYSRRLEEVGTPVRLVRAFGQIHALISLLGVHPPADEAVSAIVAAVRDLWSAVPAARRADSTNAR
jgi:acetyl esterase